MTDIPMTEAKAKLSELVDRAKRGEEIYLTSRGVRAVQLVMVDRATGSKPVPANVPKSTPKAAEPTVAGRGFEPDPVKRDIAEKKQRLADMNARVEETQDQVELARLGREIPRLKQELRSLGVPVA